MIGKQKTLRAGLIGLGRSGNGCEMFAGPHGALPFDGELERV